MTKTDLKKEWKHLFNPPRGKVVEIEVPPFNFIMIDGRGDPNTSPQFQEAVQALYGLAYGVKFLLKKSGAGPDFTVMPLEGLWWTEDVAAFSLERKDDWQWRLMIMQPGFVTADHIVAARSQAQKKKDLATLERVHFEAFREGLAAQIMHLGPYSAEGPNVARLHRHIEESGGRLAGLHHEIYLSDPRRAAPERMKTIIRQPFVRD